MNAGKVIRRLRRQQGRTLQEIADRSRLTKSMLSKIENDKTNPSIASLSRIADSLGVETAVLLGGTKENGTVHTAAQHAEVLTPTDKGYSFHAFAAGRSEKALQPFLFVAKRGEVLHQPLSHAGEEFVYVLSGRMRYTVAGTTYTLGPGDSLYFDAENDHDLEPVTHEVRYLAFFAQRTKGNPA